MAVIRFVVTTARSLHLRYHGKVLVQDLLYDFFELLQESVIDLKGFHILLAILFDEIVLRKRDIVFPSIEEENLFILIENSMVDLQLFLF